MRLTQAEGNAPELVKLNRLEIRIAFPGRTPYNGHKITWV